jgi:hypothetical protein
MAVTHNPQLGTRLIDALDGLDKRVEVLECKLLASVGHHAHHLFGV